MSKKWSDESKCAGSFIRVWKIGENWEVWEGSNEDELCIESMEEPFCWFRRLATRSPENRPLVTYMGSYHYINPFREGFNSVTFRFLIRYQSIVCKTLLIFIFDHSSTTSSIVERPKWLHESWVTLVRSHPNKFWFRIRCSKLSSEMKR